MVPAFALHLLERAGAGAPPDPAATSIWQASVDALPDTIAILDAAGRIVAVNAAWAAFAAANGGARGTGVGADYLAVCDAERGDGTAAAVARAIRAAARGETASFQEEYACHAPHEERWFSVLVRRLCVGDDAFVLVAHRDITQRRLAEREHAAHLAAADAALIATDADGIVTRWTDAAQRLYGWTAAEVVGRPFADIAAGQDEHGQAGAIRDSVVRTGRWEGRFDVRRKDGSSFPAWVRHTLLRDDAGVPCGFVGVARDITDRVRDEQVLRGTRDLLQTVTETMPDGLCVLDAGGRVVLANRAAGTLLGWPGDALLGQVMHDVAHAVGEDGSPHLTSQCPMTRAQQTEETVRVDSDVFARRDGSLIPVSYSATACAMPDAQAGLLVVFRDISERKERERHLVQDAETLAQVSRIRDALDRERFVLYAQPVVDLRSGVVSHHELLIRMLDEDGGIVPPGVFLPAAERTGLIREIDRYVIERAMRHAAAGRAVGLNISAASLSDPHLAAFVEERLRHHGADPSRLVFEITETALMEREDAAQAFVNRITELGCAMALDDFGTGFGTFRYLKHLPAGVLKIDREFVKDVTTDPASAHVVETIVHLATGMGKQTVAEGVEDAATLTMLRDMGVDFAQGYLLGRPAPFGDAVCASG